LERDRRKASGEDPEQDRGGEHRGEYEGAAQDERASEDDQDGPPWTMLAIAKLHTFAVLSMGRAARNASARATFG